MELWRAEFERLVPLFSARGASFSLELRSPSPDASEGHLHTLSCPLTSFPAVSVRLEVLLAALCAPAAPVPCGCLSAPLSGVMAGLSRLHSLLLEPLPVGVFACLLELASLHSVCEFYRLDVARAGFASLSGAVLDLLSERVLALEGRLPAPLEVDAALSALLVAGSDLPGDVFVDGLDGPARSAWFARAEELLSSSSVERVAVGSVSFAPHSSDELAAVLVYARARFLLAASREYSWVRVFSLPLALLSVFSGTVLGPVLDGVSASAAEVFVSVWDRRDASARLCWEAAVACVSDVAVSGAASSV